MAEKLCQLKKKGRSGGSSDVYIQVSDLSAKTYGSFGVSSSVSLSQFDTIIAAYVDNSTATVSAPVSTTNCTAEIKNISIKSSSSNCKRIVLIEIKNITGAIDVTIGTSVGSWTANATAIGKLK